MSKRPLNSAGQHCINFKIVFYRTKTWLHCSVCWVFRGPDSSGEDSQNQNVHLIAQIVRDVSKHISNIQYRKLILYNCKNKIKFWGTMFLTVVSKINKEANLVECSIV